MTAERFQRVDELFHEALGRAPQERSAMLRQICVDDSDLIESVEALLAAHERASSFIVSPAFQDASQIRDTAPPASMVGQRVGRYQLRSIIGRGGMGIVYEAEQENPRRTVALKLLRDMPLRDEMTARLFGREAQALARLEHPAIATIFEAGTSGQGWRYFAMERVTGLPLTRYANEHRLSIPQRLELFVRVCDAVEYAHGKGVIHRDLKPANIIVSSEGQPKVLDFGAALLRDPDSSLAAMVSLPGQLVGTLPYMSPEQVNGERARIGPATDVYSLGVTLYELLIGKLPYDLSQMTLMQAAATICSATPPAPSAMNAEIRPDLDCIILGALAKQPETRYASPAALAVDIRRVLHGERVRGSTNRPGMRRRALIAGAAVGIVALALFLRFVLPTFSAPPPQIMDNPIVMVDSPFRPEFRRFLGSNLEQEETELRRTAESVPKADRAYHGSWRDLGVVLELQGRFADAYDAYSRALDVGLGPKAGIRMKEMRAGVIAVLGRPVEAEQIWTGLLADIDNPEFDSPLIARVRVRYGLLLAQMRRRPEAIEQIEAAIRELERPRARPAGRDRTSISECLHAARELLVQLRA